MSTYLYLKCLNHNPHLLSENESGQHLYDLPRIQAELANRVALVAEYEASDFGEIERFDRAERYFATNTARFLSAHRLCSIGVEDEYGREHPAIADQDGAA